MSHVKDQFFFGNGSGPELNTLFTYFAMTCLALALLPSLLVADIYRCKSESGVVTYSDEPCGDHAEVAFENYVMGVEEAARREIIRPTTDHHDEDAVLEAMADHAQTVGSCIFRNKEFTGLILSKTSRSYSKNDLSYSVNMGFGSEGDKVGWVIKVFYEGRMAGGPSVSLKAIKIFRGNKPFDATAMRDLKSFRKIKQGEWEYRRQ